MADLEKTTTEVAAFDFSAYPPDTLFLDRRTGLERRGEPAAEPVAELAAESDRKPRARKDRRRRVDPTTFEKQYREDEVEFMTAIQRFKDQSGKVFPSHRDTLLIAHSLGYVQHRPEPGELAEPIR